jgi:hypothetical protein
MRNILHKIIREQDKHLLKETGVYQIKNKENKKVYIGSTSTNFSKRLSSHIGELINNKHHSKHLQNCFNQNPNFDYFEISILEVCRPEDCIKYEQIYLDLYKPYDDKFGYNISPTAKSCLGIKKSKEDKIRVFERMRKLTDEQLIEIFNCRNVYGLSNSEISLRIGISKNSIATILTKSEKYKYIKEKYNLELKVKHEKKFTKQDVIMIHELYENQKLSIYEISKITNFGIISLRHLIYNQNIYKNEKDGLFFNIEINRKKGIKINRKSGIKIKKNILKEEIIKSVFNIKHSLGLSNEEISYKLNIDLKNIDLILNFRYQLRIYNQLYLELKTEYNLRKNKNNLTEQDIIDIFKDYNSGEYLINDLRNKYNYNDFGILFSNSKRLSEYYKVIIEKNNLKVDRSLTKNHEIKSKSISDRNKKISKNYKLTDPLGNEYIIKNLSKFCSDKDLYSANLSRVSKNGGKYKGWSCVCLD